MHISQLKESKYLKKEDCGKGILVTIHRLEVANVAKAGDPEEEKHILCFSENVKPLVLNSINAQLIARITGSEETDDWTGKQIVCYTDPSIVFAGKLVGGIRVRAPKLKTVPVPVPVQPRPVLVAPPPAAEPSAFEEEDDDSVPF